MANGALDELGPDRHQGDVGWGALWRAWKNLVDVNLRMVMENMSRLIAFFLLCLLLTSASASGDSGVVYPFEPYLGSWASPDGLARLHLGRNASIVTGSLEVLRPEGWAPVYSGDYWVYSGAYCGPINCEHGYPMLGEFSADLNSVPGAGILSVMLIAQPDDLFLSAGAPSDGLHFYTQRLSADFLEIEGLEYWGVPQGGRFTYQVWHFSEAGERVPGVGGEWLRTETEVTP